MENTVATLSENTQTLMSLRSGLRELDGGLRELEEWPGTRM